MKAVLAPTASIQARTASATNSGPFSLARQLIAQQSMRGAANEGRWPPQDEEVGQGIDHVDRVQLPLHADCQAFSAELVQDVQCPESPPIVGPAMHEVIRPDMVPIGWPQTNAGSVIQPEPAFLRLLGRNFQPLASPQPFDPTIADLPSRISQQSSDTPIAIAAILPGQLDHISHQLVFVISSTWAIPLRGPILAQHTTNPSFGNTKLTANLVDAGTATRGAQKFLRAASFKMSLSKVKSDTALRSRSFSF